MAPIFDNGNVRAMCPDCGVPTTFEYQMHGNEFGSILIHGRYNYHGVDYPRLLYRLLKCAGCGRGGIAKLHLGNDYMGAVLEAFLPVSVEKAALPPDVPEGIEKEFREAEICASAKAYRSATAMLKSTLEKTLKENGYITDNLQSKIDAACDDRIITESRKQKAHDDVRVLGNDVLHDEWREVSETEYDTAHHYVQRIIEDFYDDRASVESLLRVASRI